MPKFTSHAPRRRIPAAGAVALVSALLACGALTACGESTKTTSNAAATGRASGSTTTTSAAGASTTPTAPSSTTPSSTTPAGTATTPAGTATAPARGALHPQASPHANRAANTPFFRHALIGFAACVRHQGFKIPEPNTQGRGPIFDTRGLDTKNPKFRAALAKCRGILAAALRSRERALHAGGGGAAAPAK